MTSAVIITLLMLVFFAISVIFVLVRELIHLRKLFIDFAKGDFKINQQIIFLYRPLEFMANSLSMRQQSIKTEESSVLNDSQTHRAILNVLDDIESARRELESEKIKFGLVLENLGDAVVVLDREGRIIYFNPAMAAIFGPIKIRKKTLLAEMLLGMNARVDINRRISQVVDQGQSFETEIVLPLSEEQEKNVKIVMAPLVFPDSKIHGVVAVFHDMTDIRKLDRLKYDFIATISHELRTPLTVISESIDLLKTEMVGHLEPKQKECVELASRNLERLSKLVDSVLDVVKIETGHFKVEIKKVFLYPLVSNLVKSFIPVFEKINLKIIANVPEDLAACAADDDRLAQILANLINNSLKFTSAGRVEISAKEVHGQIEMCVEDTGSGIPEKDTEKIFQKYEQLPKGNQKPSKKGSGLGLFIVKNLVEAMGGKIWVESTVGVGAKFKFTIPLYKEAKNAAL